MSEDGLFQKLTVGRTQFLTEVRYQDIRPANINLYKQA